MFHAQQAVEKVLKAFLTWHDEPFRKTHDLRELGRQCVRIDAALDAACSKAEALTPFAWEFRYPEESSTPSVKEAQETLALAREVYQTILSRLPDEVQP
jgi:HEPN domain-containing protein